MSATDTVDGTAVEVAEPKPAGTQIDRPAPRAGVVVPTDPINLGNVLAQSGFFADSRQAAQAAVKVMAGQELGFGPIASMTGIAIVKGRVTLSANLMAAAIKRHPGYSFTVTQHTDEVCEIEFREGGRVIGTSKFTMDDAKQAGLAGGDNYRKYPRNMLYARALSNGAKWYCADAFSGSPVYTPDELGGEINGETGEPIDAPAVEIEEASVEDKRQARDWLAAVLDDKQAATDTLVLLTKREGGTMTAGAALAVRTVCEVIHQHTVARRAQDALGGEDVTTPAPGDAGPTGHQDGAAAPPPAAASSTSPPAGSIPENDPRAEQLCKCPDKLATPPTEWDRTCPVHGCDF